MVPNHAGSVRGWNPNMFTFLLSPGSGLSLELLQFPEQLNRCNNSGLHLSELFHEQQLQNVSSFINNCISCVKRRPYSCKQLAINPSVALFALVTASVSGAPGPNSMWPSALPGDPDGFESEGQPGSLCQP